MYVSAREAPGRESDEGLGCTFQQRGLPASLLFVPACASVDDSVRPPRCDPVKVHLRNSFEVRWKAQRMLISAQSESKGSAGKS